MFTRWTLTRQNAVCPTSLLIWCEYAMAIDNMIESISTSIETISAQNTFEAWMRYIDMRYIQLHLGNDSAISQLQLQPRIIERNFMEIYTFMHLSYYYWVWNIFESNVYYVMGDDYKQFSKKKSNSQRIRIITIAIPLSLFCVWHWRHTEFSPSYVNVYGLHGENVYGQEPYVMW